MTAKLRMEEKLRWRMAPLIDKLPGFCWVDVVLWAVGNDERLPRRSDASCRADMAGSGACYCGKFRIEESVRSEQR